MSDVSEMRKSYDFSKIIDENLPTNPMPIFIDWFEEAKNSNIIEANAMSLSTVSHLGFPLSRIVLLKGIRDSGLVFYTNYNSVKAQNIVHNSKVSLLFYWPILERQIRIIGFCKKTSRKDSVKYFDSRPEGSKVAACISMQSQELASRKQLESEYATEVKKANLECPKHWGGYLVHPIEFEFWQGRENRLHDRIRYRSQFRMESDHVDLDLKKIECLEWERSRLYP